MNILPEKPAVSQDFILKMKALSTRVSIVTLAIYKSASEHRAHILYAAHCGKTG